MASLERLCLDLIIKRFDQFYCVFTVSKDKNLQRSFEFLQRRYSEQFLTELYKSKNLKEEYFELLINEHLSFLDGEWLDNSSFLNSLEDIFHRLPNLTRFRYLYCFDEILENLAKFCPKIVEIDVRYSYVTDSGVESLCKITNDKFPCPEIKKLSVMFSLVTDRGVGYLIRNLPLLERIDYSGVPLILHSIYEQTLREFKEVQSYNIIYLNLLKFIHLPNYTDVLQTCLTVCPRLKSLVCNITNEEQLNLFSNNYLETVNLQFSTSDASINADNFLKMKLGNLTFLTISDCSISLSLLAIYCPLLQVFSARHVIFTDGNDLKVNFVSLTACSFTGITPSSNKGICLLLSSSPKLKSIELDSCNLSLELKIQVLLWCKNPCAENIIFRYIRIDLEMKFLKHILWNCRSLKLMTLSSVDSPGPEIIRMIEALQNLVKSLSNKPKVFVQELLE